MRELDYDIRDIISIHAPARGATMRELDYDIRDIISIHAPARGATRRSARSVLHPRYFNPRSRKGSDVS